MSPFDLLVFRFLLASGGCLAAGLGVWALTLLLRRLPAFQLQRTTWLLGQITIVAAFLVILLPHSERLRLVPPIELADAGGSSLTAPAPTAAPASASASAVAPQAEAPRSWAAYGAWAWLSVYLLGFSHAVLGLLRARRLLSGLAVAGCPVAAQDRHPGFAGAPSPNLQVIEVDAPISPMLFGLFQPRLLLPRHLRSFDPIQQQMIVQHELTHLRRHDLHWMSAGLVLQTLFWFNPFMRLLRAQLSWAQELGCDRDVLDGRPSTQRKAYAAALVAQLKTQHYRVDAALAFGGVSAQTVAERISLIRAPATTARSRWARMAALAGLALVFAGSIAFQPALAPAAQAAASSSMACTLMLDAASGKELVREGQCDERATPASTFNIAVSLMGYDSGILVDEHAPALPFKAGYISWNPAWRTTTDPSAWFKNSTVWYAQQVTSKLGPQAFQRYVQQFDYGNQDVAGDAGKDNGLTVSWISSSLRISPVEQAAFLRKLVNHGLPVSAKAHDMTARLMLTAALPNGWEVHGKTGTANPVLSNGKDDETRQYGWYVGWAKKGERTVVFARLVLDRRPEGEAAGWQARDAFLRRLPALLDAPP